MAERTVEEIKIASVGLRGGLAQTMIDHSKDGFEEDDKQLIKFHGMYQQKNRDKDLPAEQRGASFMIRGRIAGGRLDAKQYAAWDDMGTQMGNGSLRITTRQSLQLHGVLKNDLPKVMQAVHSINQTTAGACGDVVRNVTQAVNPWGSRELSLLDIPAQILSDHFLFKSAAWNELWLGEKRTEVPGDEQEPIYGTTFLPRKFKIAVTLAGNNSVDIHTNDLGLAATLRDGRIDGWFVFVGGGMGMTHNKPETYPRLSDLLGWIPDEKFLAVAEAVVGVHRDFGDRTNRKHARLKYVVQEKGVQWMRQEVEQRIGIAFDFRELPDWNTPNYLGWQQRSDGTLALGMHTLSGRIAGNTKKAIRSLVDQFGLTVQLTADQDLILLGIQPEDKLKVEAVLAEHEVAWQSPSRLFDRALACPALPTCGLAMTESERVIAKVLEAIDVKLQARGLAEVAPVLRMTGCPNGCARPYSAEIGVVGQALGRYALFLGGSNEGTHVARPWVQKVTLDRIADVLDLAFAVWQSAGKENERFGAFVRRVGIENLPTTA